MNDASPALRDLHAAVEEWLDVPDHVVELRPDGEDAGLLRELDVAFFSPAGGEGDDDITTVMTVGLGRHVFPQPDERVELVMEVKGSLNEEEQGRTARDLGNVIMQRLRQGLHMDSGTLVPGVSIHPFARMNHLLLKSWTTTPTHLPGTEPPVLVLRAIPLFESEVRLVEEKGDLATVGLKQAGAVFEDYDRDPPLAGGGEGAKPPTLPLVATPGGGR